MIRSTALRFSAVKRYLRTELRGRRETECLCFLNSHTTLPISEAQVMSSIAVTARDSQTGFAACSLHSSTNPHKPPPKIPQTTEPTADPMKNQFRISFVSFARGYGSSGTFAPRKSHSGAQPSPTCISSSLSFGTSFLAQSLCRV